MHPALRCEKLGNSPCDLHLTSSFDEATSSLYLHHCWWMKRIEFHLNAGLLGDLHLICVGANPIICWQTPRPIVAESGCYISCHWVPEMIFFHGESYLTFCKLQFQKSLDLENCLWMRGVQHICHIAHLQRLRNCKCCFLKICFFFHKFEGSQDSHKDFIIPWVT